MVFYRSTGLYRMLEAWIAQANNTMTPSTLLLSNAGLGITGFAATYWWSGLLISIVDRDLPF